LDYSADARFVKDASLAFDFAALGERLASEFDTDAAAAPRLRFSDARIWTLVRLPYAEALSTEQAG
jgi:hypothetical protein